MKAQIEAGIYLFASDSKVRWAGYSRYGGLEKRWWRDVASKRGKDGVKQSWQNV
jgi:hypothetical protein